MPMLGKYDNRKKGINMKLSKKEEKSYKSYNKLYDLGGWCTKFYNLLVVNPTLKYLIDKTGKDKRFVTTYINRLLKKGFIQRLDRGLYKVIQKGVGTNPSHTTKSYNSPHFPSETMDKLRLHNIELKLRLNDIDYKIIKNKVFSDVQSFKVRNLKDNSYYFDIDVTGLITSKNVFIFFPAEFEIYGDTIPQVYAELDKIVQSKLEKWEKVFNITLYKKGRVNYEIVNQHLEISNNPIAKGLQQDIKQQIKVLDDEDGKVALMLDLSKGLNNIESPHPTKAPEYIDKAQFMVQSVKDGSYEKLCEEHQDMKKVISMIGVLIDKLHLVDAVSDPDPEPDPVPTGKPYYVG
jgi:hypothetical protein